MELKKISSFLNKKNHISDLVLKGFSIYYLMFLFVSFVLIYLSGGALVLAPDHLFLLLLSFIIIFNKGGEMIRSFSKYFILLASYDALSGFVPFLNSYVNYNAPIQFDTFIGGGLLPTKILQTALEPFQPSINIIMVFFYTLHFFIPFIFGAILWFKRKELYEYFFLSFIVASYLGLLTFLILPVAPPWLAAQKGLIDIRHITLEVDLQNNIVSMPSIYYFFNANPVAAFPSLHFAYPMITAYFVILGFGKKTAPIAILYPLIMGISIIYLGEHYILDIIGGTAYAIISIILSGYIINSYNTSSLSKIYDTL